MYTFVCPVCNISFTTKDKRSRTCSTICGHRYRTQNAPGNNSHVFWSMIKIDQDSPIVNGVPCSVWTAGKCQNGYGELRYNGKMYMAHRRAYELTYGEIPKDLVVRHLCHRGEFACCEPKHMVLGTVQQNTDDKVNAGRHIYGEHMYNAKLTYELVITARLLKAFGWTYRSIGKILDIAPQNIHKAVRGSTWKSADTSPVFNSVLLTLLKG